MEDLSEARRRFLLADFSQGFIAFCGFEGVSAEPGAFVSRVRVTPNHRQQDGFIHAGVMAAMADHTAGYAAYTLIPEDHRILTIEFKINLLRPAVGGELTCRARVIRPGRRIMVCESEVLDVRPGAEIPAARAQLTMAVVAGAEVQRP